MSFKVGQTVVIRRGLWEGSRAKVTGVSDQDVPGGRFVEVEIRRYDGAMIDRSFQFDEVAHVDIVERIGELDRSP